MAARRNMNYRATANVDSGIDIGKKELQAGREFISSNHAEMSIACGTERDVACDRRIAAFMNERPKQEQQSNEVKPQACKGQTSLRDLIQEMESTRMFDRVRRTYFTGTAEDSSSNTDAQVDDEGRAEMKKREIPSASSDDDLSDWTTATSLSSLPSTSDQQADGDDICATRTNSEILEIFMEEAYDLLTLFEQAGVYIARHDKLKQKVLTLETQLKEERQKYAALEKSKQQAESSLETYLTQQRDFERLNRNTVRLLEERVDTLDEESKVHKHRAKLFENLYLEYKEKLRDIDQQSDECVIPGEDARNKKEVTVTRRYDCDVETLSKKSKTKLKVLGETEDLHSSQSMRECLQTQLISEKSLIEVTIEENDTLQEVVQRSNEHFQRYEEVVQILHEENEELRRELNGWIGKFSDLDRRAAQNGTSNHYELHGLRRRENELEKQVAATKKLTQNLPSGLSESKQQFADYKPSSETTPSNRFTMSAMQHSDCTAPEMATCRFTKRTPRRTSKTLFRLKRRQSEASEASIS